MGWFCPTFQRPERLAELALSWEKMNPGTHLEVRVWKNDPRKEDYFKYDWPEGWHLYESDKEWAGDAFNEHFDRNPTDSFYGFIGDDVVLRTRRGLDILEYTAGKMFFSYPNDTIQRHVVSTHYCLGGDTARALGFVAPRIFYHFYMDIAMQLIMVNTGLQRYCPQVIFQHKHFSRDDRLMDDTYRKAFGDPPVEESGKVVFPGKDIYRSWVREEGKDIILDLRRKLLHQYERFEEWETEDMQMIMEEYDGPVLRTEAE